MLVLAFALLLAGPVAPGIDELLARVPSIATARTNAEVYDLYESLERRQEAVPGLLRYLRDPRPRVVAFASATLRAASLTEEALDPLVAAHRAGDRCALAVIGQIETPRAFAYWLEAAPPQAMWPRISEDARLSPVIAEYLRSQVSRPLETVEQGCLELGHLKDAAAAIEPLLSIASSPLLPLANRRAAIQWLGCIGPLASGSKEKLSSLASRFSEDVLEAIDRLDGKKTVRMGLADLARVQAIGPDGAWWAAEPIRFLGSLGKQGSAAVPALLPLLELPRDEDIADLRLSAISALGAIGDSRAIPALVAALRDPDDWRAVYLAAGLLPARGAARERRSLSRLPGW